MKLLDVILCSYPIYATYHAIKKPRNAILKHWLIYWFLWLNIMLVEYLSLGMFPFMGMIKIGILLPNWSPYLTDMTFHTLNLWFRRADIAAQKYKVWSQIRPEIIQGMEKVEKVTENNNWWKMLMVKIF